MALSHLVDEARLIHTVTINLEFLVPGQAPAITEQVAAFLRHRNAIGGVGIGALLFFSAMAFSILENAMAMIFTTGSRRGAGTRRCQPSFPICS